MSSFGLKWIVNLMLIVFDGFGDFWEEGCGMEWRRSMHFI